MKWALMPLALVILVTKKLAEKVLDNLRKTW